MTATTYTNLPGSRPGTSSGGWLGRFFWRMIEAQEQRIVGRVGKVFSTYDDAALKNIGYTTAEITRLRRQYRAG